MPYYKIVYLDGDGTERVFGAYDEKHLFSENPAHGNCWSSVSMAMDEVRDLQRDPCGIES